MFNDGIMTVKEFIDYLKIADKMVYRFAYGGKIRGFRVGSTWRFGKDEEYRWIGEQEQNEEDKA